MKHCPVREHLAVLLALAIVVPAPALPAQAGPPLNILVREGQNAVNDPGAAAAAPPVVEVQDENGRPVDGAEVTFELPGAGPGGSFHGWMRAQTLRTGASGSAAATGFAPNAETGRFEILVTAVSGARTGQATIVQTNGPATATAPPRRKSMSRNRRLIIQGVATGATAALTAIMLKQNSGSKFGWWHAALAAGSVLGFVSLLAKTHGSRTEKIASSRGTIEITPIRHASLVLRGGGAVILIDPAADLDYGNTTRPDLVLITDAYSDHFDAAVLSRLLKPGTAAYGPEAAARVAPRVTALPNGGKFTWREWEIEVVPAYNLPRGDAPGRVFHERGQGNGYLLTFGGRRLYVSGNTGNTPEMRALRAVDVAFLCMSPPYTMSDAGAVEAVRAFKPGVVYPYHYRGNLLGVFRFRTALAGAAEVRVRNWYE